MVLLDLRFRTLVSDGRAGPVGVVVGDAVAGVAHLKDQLLDSGNVHINFLGRLLAAHHAARPERLAVADHAKLDAAVAMGLVINADPGSEPPGRPLEVKHQSRVGMGAKSVVEPSAAEHERMAVHGLVRRRVAVGLRRGTEIQRREANLVAGRGAGQSQECREQNRGMQWIARRSRVIHGRYPGDWLHHGRWQMANGKWRVSVRLSLEFII